MVIDDTTHITSMSNIIWSRDTLSYTLTPPILGG